MKMDIVNQNEKSTHVHLIFPEGIEEKEIDCLISAFSDELDSLQILDVSLPVSELLVEN